MKKINWKKRFQNKAWVLTLLAALILFLKSVLEPLGIQVPEGYITAVVTSGLSVLSILGVVIDGSTPGIGDEK